MKYYKIIGVLACILLTVSCFLPWAYYPDLGVSFNGFFSEKNLYGKPGKIFVFIAVCAATLIMLNRVWAKRVLIFLSAINIAYLIKTYILFTTCYSGTCPQKQYGLYLLITSSILLMIASLFPDVKINDDVKDGDITL